MRNGWWRFGVVAVLGLLATSRAKALINAQVAAPGEFEEVGLLTSDRPSECTAVLVGPKVILTSAACVKAGGTGQISLHGHSYRATFTLHPLWPAQEVDVAAGILDRAVADAEPEWIGEAVDMGAQLTLTGAGCTDSECFHHDHLVRTGRSTIAEVRQPYLLTQAVQGALVSYFDNGGPAFLGEGYERTVVALNSFGDRQSKNYLVNLTNPAVRNFLRSFAATQGVSICGITDDCNRH